MNLYAIIKLLLPQEIFFGQLLSSGISVRVVPIGRIAQRVSLFGDPRSDQSYSGQQIPAFVQSLNSMTIERHVIHVWH